ncbi:MAG: murein biosynthesis integral membrane protein MurJ, partial [Xanthobacteraceae bacterium]
AMGLLLWLAVHGFTALFDDGHRLFAALALACTIAGGIVIYAAGLAALGVIHPHDALRALRKPSGDLHG